ncbi:TonB-dependent receptor [Flavihumibacter profundi]|uniref:TonB-dependent receptor n=1 Tax=Flavihumibacter profundi TaxID=2716883 RepID=UPI001CC784BB|nr:TonB-dependent receptor [Flavihumibacter profundi]MBZ5857962.1 TonB-dependent receptor [Flavihumibacter profundi]
MRPILTLLLATVIFPAFLQAQPVKVSGTVRGNSGEPLAGASIVDNTRKSATTTDNEGRFSLTLNPAESKTLTISAIGYRDTVVNANGASTELNVQLQAVNNFLNEVTVVGSRSSRSGLKSAVPVDIIDFRNATKILPQYDLNQALTYLAPSFNSNRQSSADGTEHIDPASLRGLGPDQVLVLVNGKRRHTTSLVNYQGTVGNGSVGTDLNTIPAAAIERIEVLRDGAAAQYGSDAIAGVINVVLKKNNHDLNVNVTGGATSKGDGGTAQLNLNKGWSLGKNGGYLNLTGDMLYRDRTNRTQHHDLIIYDQSALGNFFAYDFTENPAASRAYDDSVLSARKLTRDDHDFAVGDARIRNGSAFANLALPFGKNQQHEFYAFSGINYRHGDGFGFRRLPSETSNVVESIFPNGFQPSTQSAIWDQSIAAGVRLQLPSDWKLDISNTFGHNSFEYTTANTNNATLREKSPTTFKSGSHAFTQNTINADIKKFFPTVASGLNLAFGTEFRIDQYQIKAGEEASWRNYAYSADGTTIIDSSLLDYAGGAQSFVGFAPRDATKVSRNNIAFYADGEIDITKKFLVAGAARFEQYSDFGGTLNGKLALRYQFTDAFGLRGAVSTGFRAPSLHQQYFSYSSTDILPDGKLGQSGFFPNNSEVAKGLGIPKLKEETSVNASAGFTLSPNSHLRVSVDGYLIKIDNRIALTGNFGYDAYGEPVPEIQDLLKPYGVASARFFANAVNTTTTGIDLVASYNFNAGKNRFDVILAGNYNENKVGNTLHIPDALKGQEDIFFGPVERSIIETYTPRTKGSLAINHHLGKFTNMLRFTYFGKVTRNGYPFGELQEHKGKVVTDLTVSYAISKSLSATIGANNLLNVYPDKQVYANSYFGVFKYAPVQMGANGTYFFARLSFTL